MDRQPRFWKRLDASLQSSRLHFAAAFLTASVVLGALLDAGWTALIGTALCSTLLLAAFCASE
jgi:hypothetical protein